MAGKTIQLSESSVGPLIVLLNCELRDPGMALSQAEAYNEVYKQLTGQDHESMENRRIRAQRLADEFDDAEGHWK